MSAAAAPTLRRSLAIVGIGVRRQPWWFALAVVGSALYGVMTVGTAWVIGRVTHEYVAPAVEAGHATTSQLLAIGGCGGRGRAAEHRRRRRPPHRRGV